MCDVECYVNMVVGCGIGCDHSQMWWNDAVMQDAGQLCCVKRGAMRDGGAMHNVANISRCDLKCGSEHMECGVICGTLCKMGCNVRCGVMRRDAA